MNDDLIKLNKANEIARDVLLFSRNILLVNLRFLDMAINRLSWQSVNNGTFATDGDKLFYNPVHLLNLYKQEQYSVARDYLHTIFHCVFQHMFVDVNINHYYWDLACDIAVENAINDLGIKSINTLKSTKQQEVISVLRSKLNKLTAEKIYNYYRESNIDLYKINALRQLFIADDHSLWYKLSNKSETEQNSDNQSNQAGNQSNQSGKGNCNGSFNNSNNGKGDDNLENQQLQSRMSIQQEWKTIANRMQTEMETFGKQRGENAGGLTQNLLSVNREKYDYTSFLKKFAVMGEAMKINDDEFDYIFYTYGLKLYKKMPLIEPLEYKEVKRIKEFVIAIDTSGSTSGELVQRFVQKTYNILKSTESFFTKINVHIIQCDAEIQEDVKITNQEEFDNYLKTMQTHGHGGTDFRPVFSYVNKLLKEGEFIHLKGLIYFTDGNGAFPEQKPGYDTAFVYIDDEYNNPFVPPWAIKLVLQSDEI